MFVGIFFMLIDEKYISQHLWEVNEKHFINISYHYYNNFQNIKE